MILYKISTFPYNTPVYCFFERSVGVNFFEEISENGSNRIKTKLQYTTYYQGLGLRRLPAGQHQCRSPCTHHQFLQIPWPKAFLLELFFTSYTPFTTTVQSQQPHMSIAKLKILDFFQVCVILSNNKNFDRIYARISNY